MMNIYTAAYSNNSFLQEVLNPLNCQAPEEYISILIGDDGYNLSVSSVYKQQYIIWPMAARRPTVAAWQPVMKE